MAELVFVYGSLKRGQLHHDQMAEAEFVGEARLEGHHLVLYEESYPALVSGSAESAVVGEVFRVTGKHLERLDDFEDCPELYQRKSALLTDGTKVWVYVITNERGARYPKIEGPWDGRR